MVGVCPNGCIVKGTRMPIPSIVRPDAMPFSFVVCVGTRGDMKSSIELEIIMLAPVSANGCILFYFRAGE